MLLGAVLLAAPLAAQERPLPPPPPPPAAADTTPRDSAAVRAPAARPDSTPRDTIKPPFVASERPRGAEFRGRQYVWTRETIFVTGANNLAELIAEVPGVSIQRSGYLMAPIVTSWFGEPGRVRVFLDGVEIDALDPRMLGQLDLSTIPLYGLEEVAVERAASELRVHLRSWRAVHTTPATRVDIGTGAENFTSYRGYYAKRLKNGGGVQLAGQQFGVVNGLTRGDGDSFSVLGRLGWADSTWSVDAVALSTGRNRNATRRYIRSTPDEDAIARFEGRERLSYVRVGYRQPDADGLWLQAIASAQLYLEDDSLAASDTLNTDPDTLRSQSQFVLSGGWGQGPLRISGTGRYRVRGGVARLAPSVRASFETQRVSVAAFGELDGPDSTRRLDLSARLQPLPWLHLAAAAGQQTPANAAGQGPTRNTLRVEAGVEFKQRWVSAGVLQRSAAQVLGMPVYDTAYGPAVIPESQGLFVALGGPVWGPFSLELQGIDWGGEELFRPRHQARSVLSVETALRRWLKRDTFLLRASFIHDYRSDMLAPDGAGGTVRAKGTGALSTLVDIRLGSAHLFFHNRNFTGEVYETVPGYLMPRLIQMYGVRWDFWN